MGEGGHPCSRYFSLRAKTSPCTLGCLRINLVVIGVVAQDLGVNDLAVIVHMNDGPIVITSDVEGRSIGAN